MNRGGVVLLCLVIVAIIGGAGLLSGVNPLSDGRDSGRPPCDQLPSRQEVADALASHQDLATRIREVGPG